MIQLLDEYIPFVAGSEINDDPFAPISRYAKDIIREKETQLRLNGFIEMIGFLKS